MIERYSRPEMARVWNDRHRYQIWLKVELAVCSELARQKMIPLKDWKELRSKVEALLRKGGVDAKRVDHHESVTRHDVIAFTTAVAEEIGPISRYIHFGLTSSDVVDTALSLQIQEAGALLLKDIENLLTVLKRQAKRYAKLPTIGRSHGIFAEPTSFGLKFLSWHAEWTRNHRRLAAAVENLAVGKLSGAVGVNAHWGPAFEEKVLKSLGLERETVSTQVIPRDRHAEFFSVLAICGSSMERIAIELRHLQRSEVGEVLENFKKGQKGSSAMPHKRNPISSENLTGASRLLRSYAQAALENVALWHERDISHSSVERVAFPDATILLDYALNRLSGLVNQVVVRQANVKNNLKQAGSSVFSGHFLLDLVRAGVTREDAYAWVQSCALESFETGEDFLSVMAKHPEISRLLSSKKIRELGSIAHQLRNVPEIFKRSHGSGQKSGNKTK
jgi:adenylosuccinate lyase